MCFFRANLKINKQLQINNYSITLNIELSLKPASQRTLSTKKNQNNLYKFSQVMACPRKIGIHFYIHILYIYISI